jgi:hypothetical protein
MLNFLSCILSIEQVKSEVNSAKLKPCANLKKIISQVGVTVQYVVEREVDFCGLYGKPSRQGSPTKLGGVGGHTQNIKF